MIFQVQKLIKNKDKVTLDQLQFSSCHLPTILDSIESDLDGVSTFIIHICNTARGPNADYIEDLKKSSIFHFPEIHTEEDLKSFRVLSGKALLVGIELFGQDLVPCAVILNGVSIQPEFFGMHDTKDIVSFGETLRNIVEEQLAVFLNDNMCMEDYWITFRFQWKQLCFGEMHVPVSSLCNWRNGAKGTDAANIPVTTLLADEDGGESQSITLHEDWDLRLQKIINTFFDDYFDIQVEKNGQFAIEE